MIRYIFLLTLLFGCGKIEVGGTVEVNHNLNFSELREYFVSDCRVRYPTFSEVEVQACADQLLVQWFNNIGSK